MIEQGRSFSGRERKCCFLNTGQDEAFATISALSGADYPDDARALAVVDWDQDGYPDLLMTCRTAPRLRLLHNRHPHVNHFVAIQLQGNGVTTNRDAIGARVEVVLKGQSGKRLVKSLRAGEGFLSQSSKCLNFGLGKHDTIAKILVHWPAGAVEEFTRVEVDKRYVLIQGSGSAQQVPSRSGIALKPTEQQALPAPACISVPLVSPLPMPRELFYLDFQDNKQRFPFASGRQTLIVLWASWCKPCQSELIELASRYSEIKASGIEIVALALDGLNDDGSSPDAAKAFCAQRQLPFPTGKASLALTETVMWYHHTMVVMNKQLPIPVSVLVNGQGQMTDIYKGKVSVEDLLRDGKRQPVTLLDRWKYAACLPGTMMDHAGLMSTLIRREANIYYTMGEAYAKEQLHDMAADYFRAALQSEPTYTQAHQQLALSLSQLGRDSEAVMQLTKAIKLQPDLADLHVTLGEIHAQRKRTDEASACYREALRLDPQHGEAKQRLARIAPALR